VQDPRRQWRLLFRRLVRRRRRRQNQSQKQSQRRQLQRRQLQRRLPLVVIQLRQVRLYATTGLVLAKLNVRMHAQMQLLQINVGERRGTSIANVQTVLHTPSLVVSA